jgi:hypothetical protein
MPVSGRIDRMMLGYFDMKRKAEGVVADSGLPWTTIRATQFHDLILMVLEKLTKLPVVPVPSGVAFQAVDADEVAARLDGLARGQPSASFRTSQVRPCTERRFPHRFVTPTANRGVEERSTPLVDLS